MQKAQRLGYVDIAKGFAIVGMVYGHTYSTVQDNVLMIWIYSFHMPLFFLTTGFLYRIKANEGNELRFSWKNKLNTLLLPYFFWNILYQLFVAILAILGGAPIKDTILNKLNLVLTLEGSAMWFLPAMFLASMFFLISVHRRFINMLLMLILGGIGIFASGEGPLTNALLRSFIGAVFISFGFYFCRLFNKKIQSWKNVVVFIISLFTVFINGSVSIASRDFNNPVLYFFNGCVGTYIVYQVAINMRENYVSTLLQLWGQNSIKILCLHGFVAQIVRLLDYRLFNNRLPQLGFWEGIVFTSIIMVILTVTMPFIIRYFNWSFGIKNMLSDKNHTRRLLGE